MGGYGSGWHRSAKTVVEDCKPLDIGGFQRDGLLAPNRRCLNGVCSWTRRGAPNGSIGYDIDCNERDGSIRLYYVVERDEQKISVDYRVSVSSTQTPWGGLRWWFLCPLRGCGRRVGKLYLPPGGKYFGCRKCYELTYTSCRESHKRDGLFRSIARDMGVSMADVMRMW